jgi:amino acid permease
MNTPTYQPLDNFVEPTDGKETKGTVDNSASNFWRAVADIYITMVGVGIFALPISMLPMGIVAGMIFVVIASILSLFANYELLYAMKYKGIIVKGNLRRTCHEMLKCSEDGLNEPLLLDRNGNMEKEGSDPYFEIIGKFLNFPFAEGLFSIIYWILILICCMSDFMVLKSYLISIFNAEDTTALQANSAGLWIFIVAILAIPWSILKTNARAGVFDRISRLASIIAAMTTTVAALGAITVFVIQWSLQGYPLRNFGPQPIPEKYLPVSTSYIVYMYLGAAMPTLCMAFLNHTTMLNIVKNLSLHSSGKISKSLQFQAIWKTQFIVTILYAVLPFFALLTQGNAVKGNVLLTMTNLDGGDTSSSYVVMGKILQACSGLGVLGALFNIYLPTLVKCTFKLPLVSLCDKLRDKKFPCWGKPMMAIAEPLATCVSSIGCYLVAILSSGGLDLFMSLGGSLSASAIMFIFPGIVFARIILERTKLDVLPKRKCWGYSMVLFACITVFAGLIFAVFGTFWIFKVGLTVPDGASNSTIMEAHS